MIGNLTRDPDFKQLSSGQPVCQLGLASNRQYRNKQTGSMVQEVCFIDVDVFGPQAESCRQFLQKGRPVLVEGRLKFDTWESQEGQKRNKYSIVADRVVFLGSGAGSESEAPTTERSNYTPRATKSASSVAAAPAEEFDMEYDEASSAKSRGKKSSQAPELEFKDEPPFQDDLPF